MPSNDSKEILSPDFTQEELHHLMVECAPIGIFSTNIAGEIIYANRALNLLVGCPTGNNMQNFNILTHPTTLDASIDKTFSETLENGLETTFIGPYTSPWGKELYLRVLSTPIVSQIDGKVKGLLGIVEDISPQIRAQKTAERLNHLLRAQAEKLEDTVRKRTEELARSEERFRKLVETMETGLWVANQDEITSYVNPWLENLLGCSHEEMTGRSVFDFIAPEDHDKLREIDKQRYEENIPSSSYELTLLKKDGSSVKTLLYGVALLDSEGKVAETFATISDITSQKLAEKERETLLKSLQELEKVRSEFIASVSHEFRTPLTVVRGHSELLMKGKKGALTPEITKSVSSILRNARRLERLADDLLELLRIESETFKLDIRDFNFTEIIRDICSDFQYLIEGRQHTLHVDVPDLMFVTADPERLSQVLGNLLENAILYTPSGGNISIRASSKQEGLVVSILDDGAGIPAENHSAVFDKFFSLDTPRKTKGMGIGLTVCKELIERHGGKIWLEPGLHGKGTSVSFLLPSQITEKNP